MQPQRFAKVAQRFAKKIQILCMNILVIFYGALGDMLVATPALRGLREHYPDATITFITNTLMPQIAPAGTLANTVISCTDSELNSIFFTAKLGRTLSHQNFDLAINLRYTSQRSALLTWLSRATVRIGAGPRSAMWCYTMKLDEPSAIHHEAYRSRDVMTALGIPVTDLRPFIHVATEHTAFAEKYFSEEQFHGEEKSLTIAIHPGASQEYRAWRPERFAEIGRRLVRDYKARIIVTWADHERNVAETVVRNIGDGAHLAPPTPESERKIMDALDVEFVWEAVDKRVRELHFVP